MASVIISCTLILIRLVMELKHTFTSVYNLFLVRSSHKHN